MTPVPIDSVALARAVDSLAATWAVPGGVVVVTNRNALVFQHAFGFADVERGIPTSADHLFQIGSISKIFTATIVMQLVDEGTLSLDQSPGEILDWLPPVLAGPELTLERLLGHSAGLVSGVDAVPDQVAQVASFTGQLSSAPAGEFFHYSNLGYILLGLVVEQVLGAPLSLAVDERILAPLGMSSTVSTITNASYPVLARGYRALDDDRIWLPGDEQVVAAWLEVDGADGALAMTGEDLAIFARMVMAGSPAVERMTTTFAPGGEDTVALAGLKAVDESRYGLGINVETCEGRSTLSHGGGMVGYASFLLADLDAGIGVIVLTNSNGVGPIAEVVARSVAGTVIGSAVLPPLAPEKWAHDGDARVRPRPVEPGMLGTFVAGSHEIVVSRSALGITLRNDGETSELLWSWGDSIGTRHPRFRRFGLFFDGECWLSGVDTYRPFGVPGPVARPGPVEYCGHFRTYSPWFPNFRVVDRAGSLVMISAPAVESPGDEVELVAIEPGVYRIGSDPRLPERLTFGPLVNGLAAWVDRDGCRYSRSFLD